MQRCGRCKALMVAGGPDDSTCYRCGWDADAPTRPPTPEERAAVEGYRTGPDGQLTKRRIRGATHAGQAL